eukprot:CAMPEP_0197932594 /NCGR_PEP_ID=MMETSP1439-20131203/108845_1 /TAXON_ID=66791 /ORGANISM="Gonyaulax spinifera, Strain CCMP409" /LENGTH=111 /DNA_ID=CAMNT_0043555389 /DNA_START=102 /DNA_END=438 /DNA_ORIENTATION=+
MPALMDEAAVKGRLLATASPHHPNLSARDGLRLRAPTSAVGGARGVVHKAGRGNLAHVAGGGPDDAVDRAIVEPAAEAALRRLPADLPLAAERPERPLVPVTGLSGISRLG